MGAALFTILADEIWMEAKKIQDSNNNKRPGKDNGKEIQDTQHITGIRKSIEKHGYRYISINDKSSELKEKTVQNGETCFDNIFEDCIGVLFGKV